MIIEAIKCLLKSWKYTDDVLVTQKSPWLLEFINLEFGIMVIEVYRRQIVIFLIFHCELSLFSLSQLSILTFPLSLHFPKGKVTFPVGKSTFPCNVHTKKRTYIFQFFKFCSLSPLSHFPTFPVRQDWPSVRFLFASSTGYAKW